MALTQLDDRLPPLRGLVLHHNARGRTYSLADVRRWLRLNRVVYKAEKVDLLVRGNVPPQFGEYQACADSLDLALSLRTDCMGDPSVLQSLRDAGLFDLCLCPTPMPEGAGLDHWLGAAADCGIPARVQLTVPLDKDLDADAQATRMCNAGVVAVNLAVHDPFVDSPGCRSSRHSNSNVAQMKAFGAALEKVGVEVNIIGLPLCLAGAEHTCHTLNRRQFFLDHQQYAQAPYELAEKLWHRGPITAGKAVGMLLGKHTLFNDPIDSKLLPWLLEAPWLRARLVAFHKLTRHLRLTRAVPLPIEESQAAHEQAIGNKQKHAIAQAGPQCGPCAWRHLCDGETSAFTGSMQGLAVTAQDGDVHMSPLRFVRLQKKHYDSLDTLRITRQETDSELTERATTLVVNHPPDKDIDSFDYSIEGQWCHQLPGGLRWYGFTNTEKLSTPLGVLEPPFTISAIFGGGIAQYIGFSFGRDCKIVCPMESYRHQLVLHVEEDGRYVLLRDGQAVKPQMFDGHYYAPARLGNHLEPRLSVWNIDHTLVTQNVQLWDGHTESAEPLKPVKYTVLLVCVRFARRLQAVLRSVARQEGFDTSQIEIIVAYAPNIDATEDVLDNCATLYPEIRIIRSPFIEHNANAKGFMINESLKKASGDWVMLLDADTLVPPNIFERLDAITDTCDFIAPDGRKLLTPEITAKILMGDIDPSQQWAELLDGAGEFRFREAEGIPIGFCQCVRRCCLDKVSYFEVDHFEGADWQFSVDLHKHFGKETRLTGIPVLHLDHGGSKWYGTQRHF